MAGERALLARLSGQQGRATGRRTKHVLAAQGVDRVMARINPTLQGDLPTFQLDTPPHTFQLLHSYNMSSSNAFVKIRNTPH